MKKHLFLIIICFNFLFFGCSSLYYHPTKETYLTPKQMGFVYTPSFITTKDGVKLSVWKIHSQAVEKPKAVILQFHGNGQNMSTHFLSLVWLVNHGYELIVFDYRGYGESEGEPDPDDILEDSNLVLEFALEETREKGSKLIVYGQSLGGAVAMRSVADWKQKNDVVLLCIDGSFPSYREVAKQTMNNVLFPPIGNLFAWLFHDDTSPRDSIAKLSPIPLLIIHGTDDNVVFFENGKQIFGLAGEPKVFWEIRGGGHVDWMNLGRSKFAKDFLVLLNRHLY
ncbi:alpha/beta hydrolase [Leptospira perdikensis]|uniref:Alpha/beta fold hydrolase n=1 Tax=Leptospira perdikensis TaxID=2484948 RepID=A0A4R9JJX2_9LEPT|nr:alpha/beta fold hydrolase [Leptospira perdikensis]TGL44845.1 alpha/beta fold hydrolase [Leptospira perdikensis]